MAKNKKKYMVLKLLTHVETNGVKAKVRDCAGFVVVYNSLKKAIKKAGGEHNVISIDIIKT